MHPLALTLPLIDTDRMTPTNGGGKHDTSLRVRFAVAFVVLFVVWFVFRLNGYFVR